MMDEIVGDFFFMKSLSKVDIFDLEFTEPLLNCELTRIKSGFFFDLSDTGLFGGFSWFYFAFGSDSFDLFAASMSFDDEEPRLTILGDVVDYSAHTM
jgi:hypothetical protein